ncbi:DUF6752 domain-containing protein [Microbacterium esteraromaticum]|uniref:DUF6752 domain-containing protein n=1 Tax=Microbacterium esteraromaticum TaxID=57043 RepID=UPI000B3549F9|nr:DUF6752 domain-containing protein [Microbacterium esteraromaticum]
MREHLRRLARKVAPGAYAALVKVNKLDLDAIEAGSSADLVLKVAELERQIFELRQENRRVAELYDLVFARLQEDNPLKA